MHAAALALLALIATAIPPAPTRRVEDRAAFVTTQTRDALEAKLADYERATGHQIVVWIDRTLDGAALDDWAVRAFAAWKIGRKGADDGIVLFVFADDRTIDIEVGYGLEDKVSDAVAARIIREVIAPRLRAGDRDGAITAGVDAIIQSIEGTPWTATSTTPTRHESSPMEWVGYGLLVLIALALFIKYPRAGMWLLATAFRGGTSNGNGGGGFRGGGGRSGGGGARGGW